MIKNKSSLMLFASLTLGIFCSTRISCAENPLELLKNAGNNADVSYKGKIVSIVKHGKQSMISEAVVLFSPPNLSRKEFYNVQEDLFKVICTDGETEWIYFPRQKLVWEGAASKQKPKNISEEDEWKLLELNYDITLRGSGRVAGQEVWEIQIQPRDKGKPVRILDIDKNHQVILEGKQYNSEGTVVTRSYFTDIIYEPEVSEDLFKFSPSSVTTVKKHGLEPEFLTLEQLKSSRATVPDFPRTMPEGFVFESGNFLSVQGKKVTHLRFTDGMIILSLFVSEAPVSSSRNGSISWEPVDMNFGMMGLSTAGKVFKWRRGKRYYTLVGNLSSDTLDQIAKSIK